MAGTTYHFTRLRQDEALRGAYQHRWTDRGMTASGALETQARVIGALMLRETRVRFGRTKLGYLWAILQPVGWIVMLSLVFGFMGRLPSFGASMPLYFATGVLPFLLFQKTTGQLTNAYTANQSLFVLPIVKELDTLIARSLIENATTIVSSLIVFAGLMYLEGAKFPRDIAVMALALVLLSLLAFGVGSVNAAIVAFFPAWQRIYAILTRPLVLVSGVIFDLEGLPTAMREILAWNPLAHGIALFRSGYFYGYRASFLDVSYLLACGTALALLGLAMEKHIRMRR